MPALVLKNPMDRRNVPNEASGGAEVQREEVDAGGEVEDLIGELVGEPARDVDDRAAHLRGEEEEHV